MRCIVENLWAVRCAEMHRRQCGRCAAGWCDSLLRSGERCSNRGASGSATARLVSIRLNGEGGTL